MSCRRSTDYFVNTATMTAAGRSTLLDFANFRQTFGTTDGNAGYLGGFDADGDDIISLNDFAAFRQSFGS